MPVKNASRISGSKQTSILRWIKILICVFLLFNIVLIRAKSQTVTYINGNIYHTVRIAKQIWMAENLKTTNYNDGTDIRLITNNKEWQEYKPGFCWYNNDEKTYKDKYGALYNWYAVNTNKLCPIGWHVPDTTDVWHTMFNFLTKNGYGYGGSEIKIAKALASTSGWVADTTESNPGYEQQNNNSTGFNGLPGGIRGYSGEFVAAGESGLWWSSSEYNTYLGRGWQIAYNYNWVISPSDSKRDGFSVRCIKD